MAANDGKYQKELKKVKGLLIAGFIIAIGFVIYAWNTAEGSVRFGPDDIPAFIGLTCYPLGVAYGWRRMLNIALSRGEYVPPDRYYTLRERNDYKYGKMMSRVFLIGLVITLGWIIGVYQAIKTLVELKSETA